MCNACKCCYTRSGLDDLSDEELNEETEENHQGTNDGTACTELPSLAEVETDSTNPDTMNKSSDDSPVVYVENTENNSGITKSTSPSPESSEDKKETKDEVVTESNGSGSDDKPSTEKITTPTLETFEVSQSRSFIVR